MNEQTVIEWSRVPVGYNWIARDENKKWHAYIFEPVRYRMFNWWLDSRDADYTILPNSVVKNPPKNWTQCKFKRP